MIRFTSIEVHTKKHRTAILENFDFVAKSLKRHQVTNVSSALKKSLDWYSLIMPDTTLRHSETKSSRTYVRFTTYNLKSDPVVKLIMCPIKTISYAIKIIEMDSNYTKILYKC